MGALLCICARDENGCERAVKCFTGMPEKEYRLSLTMFYGGANFLDSDVENQLNRSLEVGPIVRIAEKEGPVRVPSVFESFRAKSLGHHRSPCPDRIYHPHRVSSLIDHDYQQYAGADSSFVIAAFTC